MKNHRTTIAMHLVISTRLVHTVLGAPGATRVSSFMYEIGTLLPMKGGMQIPSGIGVAMTHM
jgi:hypothetical protein